ncbi:MAG: shikimate dehydrogenase [Nanoarchaeota archaeon]
MKFEVCIPIIAPTLEKAIGELKEAEKSVDLIELRIDYINNIDEKKLKKILEKRAKKAIVTCRPKSLCGNFEGSEEERINLLKKAVEFNADFIDIEIESGKAAINELIENKHNAKVIVSYHNLKETPPLNELQKKYEEIKKLSRDLIKIVANANSINDNFIIFELLKNKSDLIAFCMGIRGQISRILAPKYGSRMTFASLKEGKESASGQISIEEMKNVYNIGLINKDTQPIGVIGSFAENSMSKNMHNSCFKQKNLNYVYMPLKVAENELKKFMENFRKFNFKGASVTIPHKLEVMDYIDEVDEIAKSVGAVNILSNNSGKIIGSNSDCYGAMEALKEKTSLKNKRVLVIGAGGGARAIIYGLKKENAAVTLTNRTLDKAKSLANEFNIKYGKIENMKELIKNSEIIINTTSVGMKPGPDESIIKEEDLAENKIVMDIVYKPIETKMIKMARKAKCVAITGDRMLAYQALEPFKMWTGQDADFELMENALLEQIRKGE